MRGSFVGPLLLVFAGVSWGGLGAQTRAQKPEMKHGTVVTQYAITGIVVSSIDGSSVPHCKLTPKLEVHGSFGNRRFPASTDSFAADDHGRFSIPLPSAGGWNLRASARGYVTQSYEEHGAFSSSVVLTADSPTIDIRFALSPEASIKGIVLDEAGEPVRDAQISLSLVPPPSPGGPPANGRAGANARTDDRGMYELVNLSPGSYRLMARSHPWYAEAVQQSGPSVADGPPLDPSLDVAYPPTWFPGISDVANAETIVLHAGDTRQADFHLVPIPSIHLKIIPPTGAVGPAAVNGRQAQALPMVEEISPDSTGPRAISVTTRRDPQGEFDVSGLTPGLYQVRLMRPGEQGRSTIVDVKANSVRTLDLGVPPSDIARITIHIDGLTGATAEESGDRRGGGLRVNLIDTDTQRGTFSSMGDEGRFAGRRVSREPTTDLTLEVPPGRYEVVLQGGPNVYLIGLTAKGADASGRYMTVSAGETTLTVHVANGRTNLSGIATIEGKPVMGAMVLLVPITIEDPDSIGFLRQDQTNTDGSFAIDNVIPGKYILLAIDRGWQINWGDRSTLRRYLTQGVPMELKPSAAVKQNVIAQTP
jgi:Carboxypeptidase regulatory-like domain